MDHQQSGCGRRKASVQPARLADRNCSQVSASFEQPGSRSFLYGGFVRVLRQRFSAWTIFLPARVSSFGQKEGTVPADCPAFSESRFRHSRHRIRRVAKNWMLSSFETAEVYRYNVRVGNAGKLGLCRFRHIAENRRCARPIKPGTTPASEARAALVGSAEGCIKA